MSLFLPIFQKNDVGFLSVITLIKIWTNHATGVCTPSQTTEWNNVLKLENLISKEEGNWIISSLCLAAGIKRRKRELLRNKICAVVYRCFFYVCHPILASSKKGPLYTSLNFNGLLSAYFEICISQFFPHSAGLLFRWTSN